MDNNFLTNQIAINWLDAFNQHDLEKLLELYDEDALHYSPKLKIRHPETRGFISGKVALRNWWQDAFKRMPELQYIPSTLTSNAERVFMEYIRTVPAEDDIKIAEVLEIRNGLIVASRVYHG